MDMWMWVQANELCIIVNRELHGECMHARHGIVEHEGKDALAHIGGVM